MQENVTCKVAGLYKAVGEKGSSGIIHHSLKETARAVIRGQEGPDRDRHPHLAAGLTAVKVHSINVQQTQEKKISETKRKPLKVSICYLFLLIASQGLLRKPETQTKASFHQRATGRGGGRRRRRLGVYSISARCWTLSRSSHLRHL